MLKITLFASHFVWGFCGSSFADLKNYFDQCLYFRVHSETLIWKRFHNSITPFSLYSKEDGAMIDDSCWVWATRPYLVCTKRPIWGHKSSIESDTRMATWRCSSQGGVTKPNTIVLLKLCIIVTNIFIFYFLLFYFLFFIIFIIIFTLSSKQRHRWSHAIE